MSRMDESTLGSYWVDEHGEVWKHIVYSDQPTATLERVDMARLGTRKRVGGVVGAPIFDGFTRLVKEER